MTLKKFAIIVAGGYGVRMNSAIPKQFISLNGKPILYYTIISFLNAVDDIDIILVLPKEYMSNGEEIIKQYFRDKKIKITEGGQTRFHSVKNGLKFVHNNSIIFVHDGVRCLVSKGLIQLCYEAAVKNGSAIPAITSKDSVRISVDNNTKTVDRKNVFLIQTPQTFQSKILLDAFQLEYNEGFTDEATVIEANGFKPHIVEGEEMNLKITTPSDLLFAEFYLSKIK